MGRKHPKSHYLVKNDFQATDFLICSLKGCLVQRSQQALAGLEDFLEERLREI